MFFRHMGSRGTPLGHAFYFLCVHVVNLTSVGYNVTGLDLSCRTSRAWSRVKVALEEMCVMVHMSTPNISSVETDLVDKLANILAMVRFTSVDLKNDVNLCPLGEHALKIAAVYFALPLVPWAPEVRLEDVDILSELAIPFSSILDSGWPIFGFAHAHMRTTPPPPEPFIVDDGCLALAAELKARAHTFSMYSMSQFGGELLIYLDVEASRLNLPRELVHEFLNISLALSNPICLLAVATAQAGAAFIAYKDHDIKDSTDYLREAEKNLRSWWSGIPPAMLEEARASSSVSWESLGSLRANMQLTSLWYWPIFGILQKLQDVMFGRSLPSKYRIGIGLDRLNVPRALLVAKGAKFWETRRSLLKKIVLGPLASRQERDKHKPHEEMIRPAVEHPATFLTWNLGKVNSTAMVMLPNHRVQTHDIPSLETSRGLVIYHSGHEGVLYDRNKNVDPDGYARFFAGLGFDVISLCMPLLGYNFDASLGGADREGDPDVPLFYASAHEIFAEWESAGEQHLLSYFLAPLMLAMDWAEENLGHKEFVMVGCSGGGWTTTVGAALDPRISLSISIPAFPPHLIDMLEWKVADWESRMNPTIVYQHCSHLCMYVLSTLGGSLQRQSVHILHVAENYPSASPSNYGGNERELEHFYNELLPPILASANGRAHLSASRSIATNVPGPPLRLAVSAAKRHCGDWRDSALLETLLMRWHSSRDDIFAAGWPLPFDARQVPDGQL